MTLEVLSASQSLKFFGTASNKITDEGMQHLGKISTLETLTLRGTSPDKGIVHLSKLPLKRLTLQGSQEMSDEGLKHLSKIPTLEFLELSQCQEITPEGFSYLARNPLLGSLSAPLLPNECFSVLRSFPVLRTLYVRELSSGHIEHLLECERLTSLSAYSSTLSDVEHESLEKKMRVNVRIRKAAPTSAHPRE